MNTMHGRRDSRAGLRPGLRAGFALLAVLWVMVAATVLGTGLVLTARRMVRGATNRREAIVAQWRAEGCLERARAAITDALGADSTTSGSAAPSWRALDHELAAARASSRYGLGDECDLTARALGTKLDVDSAGGGELTRLFTAFGETPDNADSLVEALMDWRDADTVPRENGAEAHWYRAAHRALPRNGPLTSVRELSRVRGFEHLGGLDSVLTTEPARILLDRAPVPVLAALPGMTPEAIARIERDRIEGVPVPDLLVLASELSPGARAALVVHYPALVRATTPDPDAWVLTARARAGVPVITVAVEITLKRAGTRAAIVRRRTWFE